MPARLLRGSNCPAVFDSSEDVTCARAARAASTVQLRSNSGLPMPQLLPRIMLTTRRRASMACRRGSSSIWRRRSARNPATSMAVVWFTCCDADFASTDDLPGKSFCGRCLRALEKAFAASDLSTIWIRSTLWSAVSSTNVLASLPSSSSTLSRLFSGNLPSSRPPMKNFRDSTQRSSCGRLPQPKPTSLASETSLMLSSTSFVSSRLRRRSRQLALLVAPFLARCLGESLFEASERSIPENM
mmetsp:Transcript_11587/g.43238  ORF Transcript_11587/g.43238 Transcript_11587/m.43238 type:complete len:243 (-) Transcript_11587:1128-1856(-)